MVKNVLMPTFPKLDAYGGCGVTVVVAEITAALYANELTSHDHGVYVLDQRDVCWRNTSVSTALLRYEIENHSIDIYVCYGQTVLAHQFCLRAISLIKAVAHAVVDADFAKGGSLYYASDCSDHVRLADGFSWRKQHSFLVSCLIRAEFRDEYGSISPATILISVAARIAPYRIASLLRRKQQKCTRVFNRKQVSAITATTLSVQDTTVNDMLIRARRTVVAGGYDVQSWFPQRIAENHSGYPYIREPVDSAELGWLADALLWDSARPYQYLRSTGDGVQLVGGDHDDRHSRARRDRLVNRKAAILQRKVSRLSPHPQAQPAFSWAGTFTETSDGLPLFDRHPQYGSDVLFALAYGGYGFPYNMLGAGFCTRRSNGARIR